MDGHGLILPHETACPLLGGGLSDGSMRTKQHLWIVERLDAGGVDPMFEV